MSNVKEQGASFTLEELIAIDRAYWDAATDNGGETEGIAGDYAHEAVMTTRCATLSEIRAKLCWMTEGGTGLEGEENAFKMMLEDMDAILAEPRQ